MKTYHMSKQTELPAILRAVTQIYRWAQPYLPCHNSTQINKFTSNRSYWVRKKPHINCLMQKNVSIRYPILRAMLHMHTHRDTV